MTKELLEGYRSKKSEIMELRYRLDEFINSDAVIGNDVIMDYRRGYPQPQSVIGVDQELIKRTRERYGNRITKLQQECHQVEEYIEGIEDSLTRRIFRMHFLEGRSQEEVGKKTHLDRSSIGKRIKRYIEDSHNSHKSHL